jgi:hypothetical protein
MDKAQQTGGPITQLTYGRSGARLHIQAFSNGEEMNFSNVIWTAILAGALLACEAKTPQSDSARKVGDAPKQTIDKVVNETNKAIEQGEARTRDAIDGNK